MDKRLNAEEPRDVERNFLASLLPDLLYKKFACQSLGKPEIISGEEVTCDRLTSHPCWEGNDTHGHFTLCYEPELIGIKIFPTLNALESVS